MFDVMRVRRDYPVLEEDVRGRRLVYLDNAATAQVPLPVLAAVENHYRHDNANVHRGVHELSMRTTHAFEQARETVARFIGAPATDCIAFTSGATASLNAFAAAI